MWTALKHSLRAHAPVLLRNRHLDHLVLCAFYAMCKVRKRKGGRERGRALGRWVWYTTHHGLPSMTHSSSLCVFSPTNQNQVRKLAPEVTFKRIIEAYRKVPKPNQTKPNIVDSVTIYLLAFAWPR